LARYIEIFDDFHVAFSYTACRPVQTVINMREVKSERTRRTRRNGEWDNISLNNLRIK
jgi:hypothetical protein